MKLGDAIILENKVYKLKSKLPKGTLTFKHDKTLKVETEQEKEVNKDGGK